MVMDKFEKVYNSYKFGKIVLYKEIKKNYRIQEKKKHTDAVDNITPPSTNATSPSGLSCYLFNPNNKGIFSQEKLSGFSHAYVQPHSKITTEVL